MSDDKTTIHTCLTPSITSNEELGHLIIMITLLVTSLLVVMGIRACRKRAITKRAEQEAIEAAGMSLNLPRERSTRLDTQPVPALDLSVLGSSRSSAFADSPSARRVADSPGTVVLSADRYLQAHEQSDVDESESSN